MNRQQRRAAERKRKAIAKEITRMEKPEQYGLGFHDGGRSMTKAAYAAFCSAMAEHGFLVEDILSILRSMDDRLLVYAGDDELIQEAFEKTGILVDFEQLFSSDKFSMKEEEPCVLN